MSSVSPVPNGPLVLAVPNFNGAKYLRQTLNSLNAQGDCVRWWLQDGASTDGSAAIAQKMARAGDTIVSEKDSGQTEALNRAMGKMGGEIIGFINSDDLLLPGAASAVLEKFAREPELDMVVGQVEWIDESGMVTGTHAGRIESLEQMLDLYGVWWNHRQWVQPEVFWRRSLWEKVGPFNTAYNWAFDFEYWVRCWRAGARVGVLEKPLAQFRRHAAQKSAIAGKAADELRAIVGRHLADPSLKVSLFFRWRLGAMLSYDRYQCQGQNKPGLLRELFRHPQWLLIPPVQKRLAQSIQGRLGV
jgi:glycosyltransferase involved in cell wall biosynthesis